MTLYVTADEAHDAGVGANLSDEEMERLLKRVCAQIDAWTHRTFGASRKTITLDGPGYHILQVGIPIISVEEVVFLDNWSFHDPVDEEVIDPRNYRVYNRHISQELFSPDDRNNPKIEFISTWCGTRRLVRSYAVRQFPKGVQNIQVTGIFGYTDPDGGETLDETDGITPVGVTPEIIKQAALMLAARDVLPIGDVEGRVDASLANRVASLRTRDQSITYSQSYSTSSSSSNSTTTMAAGITQNPEIMAMLAPYCRGPAIGAV